MSFDTRRSSQLPAGSRVVMLYDELLGDSPDLLDGQVQRQAIFSALQDLDLEPIELACDLDLSKAVEQLRRLKPDVVFNLVEALGGSDRLMPLATLLLESLGIPYTGCGSAAIVATNDKPAAKRRMRELGLPTADSWYVPPIALQRSVQSTGQPLAVWSSSSDVALIRPLERVTDEFHQPVKVIIKAIAEHASVGIDDHAIVTVASHAELVTKLQENFVKRGVPCFAERFIEGREFNLSILDGRVLPVAEIVFEGWQVGKPQIVGYAAKWLEASSEYEGTPRTFEFSVEDQPLIDQLVEIGACCWKGFGLSGAARVDFRVDEEGRPWILEVNANPCLNPDGGFAAACGQAGVSYSQAIRTLVDAALNS